MAKEAKTVLELAFENDSISNIEIFETIGKQIGLSFDNVQAERKEYREVNGLPPLRRGPKPVAPPEFSQGRVQVISPPVSFLEVTIKLDNEQFKQLAQLISQIGKTND